IVKIEFVRSIALLIGRQIVIDFLGALESSAGAETSDVAFECRALFERTELQTEADMRADIDIGGGETVAHEVITLRYRGLERVHHVLIGPVTDHPLTPLRHDQAKRMVAGRRFHRAGGEKQPAIVRAAQTVSRGWSQSRTRESIGQVGTDRGCSGDRDLASAQ